ncbi:MAG: hypothetical protein ACR2RL_14515, partial [Gammaproteobacteria bacterium]
MITEQAPSERAPDRAGPLDRPRGGFQRIVLPLLILGIGAAGAAALVSSKPAREPLAAREREWIVEMRAVTPRLAAPELHLYGRVETPAKARLAAAITADVSAVPAREGASMARGQTLVQLDDREARLALAEAKARVADVEAQLRAEDLRFANDTASLENERALLGLIRSEVRRAVELATSSLGSRAAVDTAR